MLAPDASAANTSIRLINVAFPIIVKATKSHGGALVRLRDGTNSSATTSKRQRLHLYQ